MNSVRVCSFALHLVLAAGVLSPVMSSCLAAQGRSPCNGDSLASQCFKSWVLYAATTTATSSLASFRRDQLNLTLKPMDSSQITLVSDSARL